MPPIFFYNPWKQKTSSFLMFSGIKKCGMKWNNERNKQKISEKYSKYIKDTSDKYLIFKKSHKPV